MFPCKPERFARTLLLVGDKVNMQMSSCAVDGTTYAVAYASVSEPGKVDGGLSELQSAASRNLGSAPASSRPASIPGMTPNSRSQRVQIDGRDRDGRALTEHAVFFVKGTRVYQASVVGAKLDQDAVDTFVTGLRFSP